MRELEKRRADYLANGELGDLAWDDSVVDSLLSKVRDPLVPGLRIYYPSFAALAVPESPRSRGFERVVLSRV